MYKALPIGVDDFTKIKRNNYYYVDKTLIIKDLLEQGGDVNLFTRPRRFGKTLTLSMLKTYFEIPIGATDNRSFFDGLAIMDADETILLEQGKYPVIFVSLKSGKQPTFEMAYASIAEDIQREFIRYRFLLESDVLTEGQHQKFKAIMNEKPQRAYMNTALKFLSECLNQYYGQPAIILIDEYDVPLENAWFAKFYDEMASFIRSLFESALKSNPFLNFAVITGCLRITKESIFTGLNNLNINSIMDSSYDEYFGFTPREVETMLSDYGLSHKMEEVQDWYDGYVFGQAEVYNPWSVLKRIYDLRANKDALPAAYWANTSSNSIVKELIERADMDGKEVIESLIEGGSITKQVHEDVILSPILQSKIGKAKERERLPDNEVNAYFSASFPKEKREEEEKYTFLNEDNLWNFLFFTGYLKKIDEYLEGENRILRLAIPNREVKKIYSDTIREWFDKKLQSYDFTEFYKGVIAGDAPAVQAGLNKALYESMSYNDYKEDFYHGFVTGLLRGVGPYRILSNRESGTGRFDLAMRPIQYPGTVILFEFKVVNNNKDLEDGCQRALQQIDAKDYEAEFRDNGFEDFIHYGVAFCRKTAFVRTDKTN